MYSKYIETEKGLALQHSQKYKQTRTTQVTSNIPKTFFQ